jgi:hypothetical protein
LLEIAAPRMGAPLLQLGALCCVVLASCGHGGSFATSTELPKEGRQAPGVVLEPPSKLPPAHARNASDERLIVLQTPLDPALPRRVVQRFFDAVLHENEEMLAELLAADAGLQLGTQGSRQSARSFWLTRFSRLEYEALLGHGLLRDGVLEVYLAGDVAQLPLARTLKDSISAHELLVRARIARTHAAKTRLFGDEILFLLSPEARTYKIRMMVEEFALP